MTWLDKAGAIGLEKFPLIVGTVNGAVAGIVGDWEMKVSIASNKNLFYVGAASCQKDLKNLKWNRGLSVLCAMLYGRKGAEKEIVLNVALTFQMNRVEDYRSELEMLLSVLQAITLERAFPNARMAINADSMLRIEGIRDFIEEINFPALIWPK